MKYFSKFPIDLVDVPPVSPILCEFKLGDKVIYTNDYGMTFEHEIIGFDESRNPMPFSEYFQDRFIYLDKDSYWFPVKAENIVLAKD